MSFLEMAGIGLFVGLAVVVIIFLWMTWSTRENRPVKIVPVPSGKSDVEKSLDKLSNSVHRINDRLQQETVNELFNALRGYDHYSYNFSSNPDDWVDRFILILRSVKARYTDAANQRIKEYQAVVAGYQQSIDEQSQSVLSLQNTVNAQKAEITRSKTEREKIVEENNSLRKDLGDAVRERDRLAAEKEIRQGAVDCVRYKLVGGVPVRIDPVSVSLQTANANLARTVTELEEKLKTTQAERDEAKALYDDLMQAWLQPNSGIPKFTPVEIDRICDMQRNFSAWLADWETGNQRSKP